MRKGAAPKRKPAAKEHQSDSAELRKHSNLMRGMGSLDGIWNPEPDGHIGGVLRPEVQLSQNEIKAIFYVKKCCIQLKPGGRTAWGETPEGKPLTLPRIRDFFDWDINNAQKHVKRPLAYGFIRVNEEGVFGLGARCDGIYDPSDDDRRTESEEEKRWVCTYPIPKYVRDDLEGLSDSERKNFVQGWDSRKKAAEERLNAEVARQRRLEHEELAEWCKRFGTELKGGDKRREKTAEKAASNGYVHTQSVHTENGTSYKGSAEYAHTRINKEAENREQRTSSSSYSSPEPGASNDRTTTKENPSAEEKTVVTAAMTEAGVPADDVLVKQTIVQCREIAPECTGEDIAAFAKAKAHLARKAENPAAYLSATVVNCFRSENWRQHLNGRARAASANAPERPDSEWNLEERIHALESWLADPALLKNPNTPTVRSDLENLRRQLAEKRAGFGTHPAGGER